MIRLGHCRPPFRQTAAPGGPAPDRPSVPRKHAAPLTSPHRNQIWHVGQKKEASNMLESPLFAGLLPARLAILTDGAKKRKNPPSGFASFGAVSGGLLQQTFTFVALRAFIFAVAACQRPPVSMPSSGELETGWRPFSRRNASSFPSEPFRRRVFARYSIVCVLRPSGLAVPLARLFILVEHEMAPQSPLGWT